MLDELADIVTRARSTMIEDLLGVVSLFGILFVGLSFSGAL